MATTALDSFGTFAANQAMQGTADFLKAHGLNPTDAVLKRITDELRVQVKAALSEALEDGKAALDAGMTAAAMQTVAATFRLAGHRAVQEVMDV